MSTAVTSTGMGPSGPVEISVDANGNQNVNVVSGGGGGGTASSVTINDPTTTTQKMAVDANGRIGINNFPATQPVDGTVDIGTMPPVDIASGQSVNIGTMPAVDIASGQSVNVGNFPADQGVNVNEINGSAPGPANPLPVVSAGQQGTVKPPAGTTAASIDYVATFPSQVSRVFIQNNYTSNIQWELDTATDGDSPVLSFNNPGNSFLLDVRCTAVHILAGAAVPVNNGAGGVTIRGWA